MTKTETAVADSLPPGAMAQPLALQRQLLRMASRPHVPWLHQEVGRRMASKLDAIRLQPRHWLDWGGWLGATHTELVQRYPDTPSWVWEPHAALAERSVQAWSATQASSGFWRGWWPFHGQQRSPVIQAPHADALGAVPGWPPEGVDMLWANMALHAAPDLPQRLAFWHQAMASQGFLMCSGLGPDTLKELRLLYREEGWGLCGSEFLDMHDVGDALVHAGFAEPVMDMEHLTLTWPDAQHLLDELQTWGGNVAWGRFAGCRTPRWRQRLLDALTDRLAGPDGRLAVTVEVVYGHAIKPTPRVAVAAEARVSLDEMRQMVKLRGRR